MPKTKSKATHDKHHKDEVLQREQLAAARRQFEHGHVALARQQCAALRQAHPRFRPAYELAYEIEMFTGEPAVATARAWEWHQAAPHSALALECLALGAQGAGLLALEVWALLQLNVLGEEAAPPVPAQLLDTPLGPLTFEQAVALDLGRMHIGDDRFDAAIAVLRNVDHPSARNNHALALFSAGDVRGAQAMAEAAWRAHADNLYALERSLRWRCWLEGMAPVRSFTATLRASAPRRAEDATARVAALRFLGDDEGADAAWEDSAGLDFWDRAPQDQCDLFQALRLPGTEPPDDATLWLPRRWVKEEDRIILGEKIVGPAATQERLAAHRDGLDAHTDYLVRACEIADEDSRFFALSVLKHRALRGDAVARQAVGALLVGLGGPDGERTDLLRWLEEHGLHTPGDPVPLRAGASVRQIRLLNIRLSTEPRPSPLPKADQALLVRMLEAMRRGASAQAHALGLQLRDRHPDEPLVLVNLAAAKELMGEPLADRERLYREALALNPDYLFARCGLARCLAAEGRTDEARALIDGLMEREEMHVSEYRSLMLAQQAIALALGDTMGVRATEKGLRELERHLG